MKINNSRYLIQAVTIDKCPDDSVPEVLFLGRSNVGKSSIINALANNKKLARTSSTPGKTQTLVFLDINEGEFRIVDAPGYGYAKVPERIKKQFASMMEEYITERENLKCSYVLLDSRRDPNPDDLIMIGALKELKKRHIIIVTKCDKFSNNQMVKIKKKFFDLFPGTTIIFTSSEHKKGIDEVLTSFDLFTDKKEATE